MNAIPEAMRKKTAALSVEATRSFANSRKVFMTGSSPSISVPMREVQQSETQLNGGIEHNPPIYLYDTSGPYTDPDATIDLARGLPELRTPWIERRADTQVLSGPSSEYGRARQQATELAALRFEHLRTPRRAIAGHNVTQMHYARRGVVTPEMEFVAVRENQRLDEMRRDVRYAKLLRQHPGQSFGAYLPDEITSEFVRSEVARRSRDHPFATSIIPSSSP